MERSEIIKLRSQNKLREIAELADKEEPGKESEVELVLSIAEVYSTLKQYEKSIQWYDRALELGTNEDIFTPLSELYRITWQGSQEWDKLYQKAQAVGIEENQLSMLLYEKMLSEGADEEHLIKVLSSYIEEELYDLHMCELAELFIKNGMREQERQR